MGYSLTTIHRCRQPEQILAHLAARSKVECSVWLKNLRLSLAGARRHADLRWHPVSVSCRAERLWQSSLRRSKAATLAANRPDIVLPLPHPVPDRRAVVEAQRDEDLQRHHEQILQKEEPQHELPHGIGAANGQENDDECDSAEPRAEDGSTQRAANVGLGGQRRLVGRIERRGKNAQLAKANADHRIAGAARGPRVTQLMHHLVEPVQDDDDHSAEQRGADRDVEHRRHQSNYDDPQPDRSDEGRGNHRQL